jgi:tRNA uridine 5-carbamoylmethylation protein Kti12
LSWLLTGEGEMILDRVDDAEKSILDNYRKLPEDEKIEFEVKTSLFGKEVSERKQLIQKIIKNEVVESITRFQGELKEKLELLHRLRAKFFQGLKEEEKSLAVAMYGIDEVKKQYQEIESEIQKLISLDSDYIKEFLAEII